MALDRRVMLYGTAIVIVLVYGITGAYILGQSGNFNVPIDSLTQAAYFTIVTISTVGYGDIVPVTGLGMIFVMILIISGLSIFLSAVTLLSGEFLSARLEKLNSDSSRLSKIRLRNHIVLIGYNTTNAMVAEKLKEQRRNFVIVSGDKPTVDALVQKGYPAFLADYTHRSDMERFMLGSASDIVIDLRHSSETIYVVLVVKKLAKGVPIAVIAPDKESETHLSDLEIDNVINPVTIAAGILTKTLDRDQDRRSGK
jgi:voltage-gated potassium channel